MTNQPDPPAWTLAIARRLIGETNAVRIYIPGEGWLDANELAVVIHGAASPVDKLVEAITRLVGKDLTYYDGHVVEGMISADDVMFARAALALAKNEK